MTLLLQNFKFKMAATFGYFEDLNSFWNSNVEGNSIANMQLHIMYTEKGTYYTRYLQTVMSCYHVQCSLISVI